MSKTLVVGGNGYIGSHMKKVFTDYLYVGRKEFDLNNIEEIKKFCQNKDIDTCIILSSTISYEHKVDMDKEPFSTNIKGLNNLLTIMQQINDKVKIIYFSSMTVYCADAPSPVTENAELSPLHTYGLSKVYAESLIKYYNFNSIIIRIPGIYGGERKSGLIYNMIQKLKKDEEVNIDTSDLGYWETLHIDDMLHMFSELLKTHSFKKNFDIYNISYGEPTDFIKTIQYIAKAVNSNSKIKITKSYKNLYLCNDKILKYCTLPSNYTKRLSIYIKEIV